MIRALTYTAFWAIFTLISAAAAISGEMWTLLQPFSIDRFEIALPSGPGWSMESGTSDSGNNWYNVAGNFPTDEGSLRFWVGFEVNGYPKNRYDWLAAEIAREVRDVEAMELLREEKETGSPLRLLEYFEDSYAGRAAYGLRWAHKIYVGSLGRSAPLYQELHVFLPEDHTDDFQFMSIYFGALCFADCTTDFPTADPLRPILQTVRIKPSK